MLAGHATRKVLAVCYCHDPGPLPYGGFDVCLTVPGLNGFLTGLPGFFATAFSFLLQSFDLGFHQVGNEAKAKKYIRVFMVNYIIIQSLFLGQVVPPFRLIKAAGRRLPPTLSLDVPTCARKRLI